MVMTRFARFIAAAILLPLMAAAAIATDYPEPKRGTFVARDFRFHTGEVLPEVKLSYLTIGNPTGEPVLVLHGTAGSAATMVNPGFAGELFGPGQPLDATKYFIIIPDAIGAGSRRSPPTGCAPPSRATITTTWSPAITGC